jgi:3-oxoacyl-[acyl-carrier-protein] synthase II
MARRVVVTGLGAVTPTGVNKEEFWQACIEGRSGVRQITRFDSSAFDSRIAGQLPDSFDPSARIDRKQLRRMDPFVQYCVVAAYEAMEDSGLDMEAEDRTRVGVVLGSGIGGIHTLEQQHVVLSERGPDRVSPFFVPMMIADIGPGQVSMLLGAKGPNWSTVSACSSAAHSIGESMETVRRGAADVMICGGAEAPLTPLALAGFCSMRALSTRNDAPAEASRPFDLERDGFVIGEGAGVIVLEELEHARARGARIYCELAGYANTADAYHVTAPCPDGEGAARSMRLAMENAGVGADDIDYINAHGTSTPLNDKVESLAVKVVLGSRAKDVWISSTKSMIGHLLGASGGAEFIAMSLSIERSVVHPTINYRTPDPDCDLDYVPNQAREKKIRVALSNSFGFGGHNVTLVARRFDG